MEVVHLKLINGDELFAKLISEQGGLVHLDDVMQMETIQSQEETVKYLFMSRYSPYSKLQSMSIARSQIVFILEVDETVKIHYETSVQYATQIADRKFLEGIADATKFLAKAIVKKDVQTYQTTVEDTFLKTYKTLIRTRSGVADPA